MPRVALPLYYCREKRRKGAEHPAKRPVQPAAVLVSGALFSLWSRLVSSYVHQTHNNDRPFLIRREDPTSCFLPPHTTATLLSTAVDDEQWAAGFAGDCLIQSLIYTLYDSNEAFDVVSWVLAFCLIDRLRLQHDVVQRMHRLMRWNEVPQLFEVPESHLAHALFTLYCLSFKWHLDYAVSIKYLVNLLPHGSCDRARILQASIRTEALVFKQLGFNCTIHKAQMEGLLIDFLTPRERHYVVSAVRGAKVPQE